MYTDAGTLASTTILLLSEHHSLRSLRLSLTPIHRPESEMSGRALAPLMHIQKQSFFPTDRDGALMLRRRETVADYLSQAHGRTRMACTLPKLACEPTLVLVTLGGAGWGLEI